MSDRPHDLYKRPIRDLRISVTDRCNFRCTYCMPKEIFGRNYEFLPSSHILRFEEIERLTRILIAHGVKKIRFTGGEPLLRRQIEKLIAMIAALDGLEDMTLTTNGSTLASKAGALREAGLKRITVSLDSLDDEVFTRMNDVDFPVQRVLEGIEAARAAGLTPIKINMMVQRGVNDRSVIPMARHFHGSGHILRFIEYMDVGSSNRWKLDEIVAGSEILSAIHTEMPLEPVQPSRRGEVARRYRYQDGGGEIGVITSVTQPFCGDCNRLRLSSEGELYTCLFASSGHDLRAMVRGGESDEEISDHIAGIWKAREDRYSEIRSLATPNLPKVEMSHIGG